MDSFRTGAKVVKINVNDDGYCIELHTSSDAWLKSFLDFSKMAQEKAMERGKAMNATDDIEEKINHVIAFDKEIKEGFEQLFGEKSYEETFNSDLVGAEYIVEFLEACMPYIEKRINERSKALDKYNPSKTGGAR